jgi:hypothetical protein
MKIVAQGVSKGHAGIPLPQRDVEFETGRVTVAEAEVGDQPTVLSLILSGRMTPDSGSVTLDGVDDAARIRELVALVDAPDVSEPAADLQLRDVVREELMFSDRAASRAAVAQVLADAGAGDYATVRVGDVPAGLRIRLMVELAAFRRGVRALVLASPDRHGGDPHEWLDIADDLAARDFAVLVVCGAPSAQLVRPLLEAREAAEAASARAAAEAAAAAEPTAAASAPPAHPAAHLAAPPAPAPTTELTDTEPESHA